MTMHSPSGTRLRSASSAPTTCSLTKIAARTPPPMRAAVNRRTRRRSTCRRRARARRPSDACSARSSTATELAADVWIQRPVVHARRAGGFSTRLGLNETNLVPRRRSSRTWRLSGWAVGRLGLRQSNDFHPPNRPNANRSFSTACPPTLDAYETAGLVCRFGAAVRTGRSLGGASRGLRTAIHPNINRRSCSATPARQASRASPEVVHRHAECHDVQTGPRVHGFLISRSTPDEARRQDVQHRQPRVPRCLYRAW